MTFADRFSNSDLDFETWSNKMVSEGKMFFPEKRSARIDLSGVSNRRDNWWGHDSTAWLDIDSIICGGLEPLYQEFEAGKAKFCKFLEEFASNTLIATDMFILGGVCSGGTGCSWYTWLAFDAADHMLRGISRDVCGPIFTEIHNECGGKGGNAVVQMHEINLDLLGAETKTQVGHISSQFWDEDLGATCPADTASKVCKVEHFG